MSRRIEIELTSRKDEGEYTWRAAGAKQPRGTVAAALVPAGASVGDVLRAELESGLEGVEVVAVSPKETKGDEHPANRIEVVGRAAHEPAVSVQYASGRRPRREDAAGAGRGPDRRRPRAPEEPRREPARERTTPRERPAARERPAPRHGTAPRGPSRGAGREGEPARGRERERPRREVPERGGPDRRERRPAVSTVHRNALLATLGPQELPIAEQLLRGGIPAVRQAVAGQEANAEAVLAIAEQLVPRVNLANWKDRATAGQAAGKELRLRDLRALVTSSRTVPLDDEARAMARALQESLESRVRQLREDWIARMTGALDTGRVGDAMRLAARPPEPGSRLPAELAVRLAEAASAAMTAEVDPLEWSSLLDAVVASPVRRSVKPQGIPDGARDAALHAAGSVPELARLLGLRIPPPPPRARVMAGGGGGRAASR